MATRSAAGGEALSGRERSAVANGAAPEFDPLVCRCAQGAGVNMRDNTEGAVGPTLHRNAQQARYGVAFLRGICAQAGYGFAETSPDEDCVAIDCTVDTRGIGLRVQVKCTAQAFTKKHEYLSWKVEDHWREKWARNQLPIYFVVVRLKSKISTKWISQSDDSTLHVAAAYWEAIEPHAIPTYVRVRRSNRLTADTLRQWDLDTAARFGGIK